MLFIVVLVPNKEISILIQHSKDQKLCMTNSNKMFGIGGGGDML
jgi:hypothetical protein